MRIFAEAKILNTKKNTFKTQKPQTQGLFYFGFLVKRMFSLKRTIFIQFKLALRIFSVFLSSIIFALAFRALHSNYFDRTFFSHSKSP